MKKGQITIFIIVGVVILVGVGLFFFNKEVSFEQEKINPEVRPVHSFVTSCMGEIAGEAILETSKYGGYFLNPNPTLDNGIAYYLHDGKNYMPSKEEFQEHISLYVNNLLFFCINEFQNFPDFEITSDDIETETKIEDEKVVFNIKYPLSISKEDNTYNFDEFNLEIPARLGVIYDSVSYLMEDQIENRKSICIACVYEISTTNDLFVDTFNYDDESVIFTIRDDNIKINDEDLVFSFANKYESLE